MAYKTKSPTNTPTSTITPTQSSTSTQTPTNTPTSTLTPTKTPTSTITNTPTISIVLPPLFAGNVQVAVKLEDTSTGCIDFQLFSCLTPTPTPTLTPTITPTSTPSVCRCIQFVNNTSNNLPFGYTQCDGTPFVGIVQSATTLYVCGSSPFGDPNVAIGVAAPCVFNTCPTPPPPAPSQSPTPTITPSPTITSTNTPTQPQRLHQLKPRHKLPPILLPQQIQLPLQ